MKRNLIVTIALLALLCSVAKTQFSADVDGSLDVANVNGNLTYTYPISNNSIDGFPLKVDLNYVANSPFTIFGLYRVPHNDWERFSYPQPAWIMGVNGFAINVLKSTNSYFLDAPYVADNEYEIFDSARINERFKVELVEGYDYCNRMYKLYISGIHQDVIKLLRSDGSVLELRNDNVMASGEPWNYTGYYYENGVNPEGFAIVEYDTTTNFPTWLKNEFDNLPNRWAYLPRVVRYYRGDGLEYVFREVVIPYGFRNKFNVMSAWRTISIIKMKDGTTTTQTTDTTAIIPGEVTPTIFYLEEINSDLKNIATFEREWHNFNENEVSINRGRSYINKFANHKITFGENDITMQVFDRTLHFNLINQEDINSNFTEHFSIQKLHFNSKESDISYNSSFFDIYFEPKSLVYFVTQIIDSKDRNTNFKYNDEIITKSVECNQSNFPKGPFQFMSYNLEEVTEPSKKIELKYHHNISSYDDFKHICRTSLTQDSTRYNLNFDYFNCIKEVDIFEKKDAEFQHIQNISYTFNDEYSLDLPEEDTSFSMNTFNRSVMIIAEDIAESELQSSGNGFYPITTISDTIRYLFNRHKTQQYFKIADTAYSYLTPDFDVLLPVMSIHYLGRLNKIILESISYERQDLLTDGNSWLFFLPIRKMSFTKTLSSNSDSCLQLSFGPSIYYGYTFKTTPSSYHPLFYSQFFTKVTKQTQTIRNIRNEVLKIYETEFIHFRLDTVNQIKITSKWDKEQSYYETALARKISGVMETINSYDDITFTKWLLPPLYGLTKREVVKDPNNNILTGKGYCYNSSFDPNNIQARRGALLADSIIGKNGTNVKLLSTYGYRGGMDMNFLTTVENSIGAKSKTYYSYSDIEDLSGDYPVGKKLYNTDDIDNVTLYKEFKEFESPVANETYVKKLIREEYLIQKH